MHRHFLASTEAASLSFNAVFDRESDLPHGLFHLVHSYEAIHVGEYIVERPFCRYIALYVVRFYDVSIHSTADKRSKHILGHLCCLVSVSEALVFLFQLVFEVSCQLMFSLKTKAVETVFRTQYSSTYLREVLIVRGRKVEFILEAVTYGGIIGDEVLESSCETRDDDDRSVVPVVHLHEEFVERVHLV